MHAGLGKLAFAVLTSHWIHLFCGSVSPLLRSSLISPYPGVKDMIRGCKTNDAAEKKYLQKAFFDKNNIRIPDTLRFNIPVAAIGKCKR